MLKAAKWEGQIPFTVAESECFDFDRLRRTQAQLPITQRVHTPWKEPVDSLTRSAHQSFPIRLLNSHPSRVVTTLLDCSATFSSFCDFRMLISTTAPAIVTLLNSHKPTQRVTHPMLSPFLAHRKFSGKLLPDGKLGNITQWTESCRSKGNFQLLVTPTASFIQQLESQLNSK